MSYAHAEVLANQSWSLHQTEIANQERKTAHREEGSSCWERSRVPELPSRSMKELIPRAVLVSDNISLSIHVFLSNSPLFSSINLSDNSILVIKRIQLKFRGTAIITRFLLIDYKIVGWEDQGRWRIFWRAYDRQQRTKEVDVKSCSFYPS